MAVLRSPAPRGETSWFPAHVSMMSLTNPSTIAAIAPAFVCEAMECLNGDAIKRATASRRTRPHSRIEAVQRALKNVRRGFPVDDRLALGAAGVRGNHD